MEEFQAVKKNSDSLFKAREYLSCRLDMTNVESDVNTSHTYGI